MFSNVLDVFCDLFFRHFLSEKDAQHRIALYCTKHILFGLCVLLNTFGSVLRCFVKNANNTVAKKAISQLPQFCGRPDGNRSTIFERSATSCAPPRRA